MASQVLQPLDEFRVGLRNRLDATLRSELLHTGAMQADERHRELVYAEWWRYLKQRFDTTCKRSTEIWTVPDLISSIQRAAGIDPTLPESCRPCLESDDSGDGCHYWSFQMRRRRWFIREHSFEGYQHLTISWDTKVWGLTLTNRSADMVILLDDKADAFDELIAERKMEIWRWFTLHKIRQVTNACAKP